MKEVKEQTNILKRIQTAELWKEIARRLNVKFGKIQMAIHGGNPAQYASLDLRVPMDDVQEDSGGVRCAAMSLRDGLL